MRSDLFAASIFAPYSHFEHTAMVSSPLSARTINSLEPVPPIAPLSASTILKLSPRRVRTFLYASSTALNSRSRSSTLE